MAKINGSCKGSSAAKYDLWIEIKQNSQDVANNRSNITAQLKLQRNDGYAGSAYNLNESDNSASLKIDDTVKDSGTMKIDTRNSAVVILASWTGYITHDEDGSLTVPVNASFTMGNTSLTGGSVSGKFKCTTIPRASTLSLGSTSVNPGGSFTFGISGVSTFNHKIICKLGTSASQTTTLAANVLSGTITIPQAWASYLTAVTKEVITITLATYKDSTLIGTKKYTIILKIPNTDAYKPSFEILFTRVDNAVPSDWGVYLKGVSQLKVSLSNAEYKYGAKVKSISIKFDGVTKTKNNSVFDLLNAGERTVTVRLTDSRGYYTEKIQSITVLNYAPPAISIKSVKRCNEQGIESINGTYLKVEYSSKHSSLSGLNNAVIQITYTQNGATEGVTKYVETDSPLIIGDGEIIESKSYTVSMSIEDAIKMVDSEYPLGSAGIPFNIKRGGNGAAFGCFAENDNELTVAWDLNLKGLLNYVDVNVEINSDYAKDLHHNTIARVFPALNLVFVRIRMLAAAAMPAGGDYAVCAVPKAYPLMYTPLSSYVNSATSKSVSVGGMQNDGFIRIRPSEDVKVDDLIYIGGIYFADRVMEV